MSAANTPTAHALRSSPLRNVLEKAGRQIEVVDGVEISGTGPMPGALADLSTCDRFGLKGRKAADWLADLGIPLPAGPNLLIERNDGLIVARYAESEFVLADFARAVSPAVDRLRQALEEARPNHCFAVPRAESQAAFGLSGNAVLATLSAVCPADLRARAFGPGDVLQTLCAGVSAQLWNLARGDATRVIVLCDASVAHHQWRALHNAIPAADDRVGPQGAWFMRTK